MFELAPDSVGVNCGSLMSFEEIGQQRHIHVGSTAPHHALPARPGLPGLGEARHEWAREYILTEWLVEGMQARPIRTLSRHRSGSGSEGCPTVCVLDGGVSCILLSTARPVFKGLRC